MIGTDAAIANAFGRVLLSAIANAFGRILSSEMSRYDSY